MTRTKLPLLVQRRKEQRKVLKERRKQVARPNHFFSAQLPAGLEVDKGA